MLGRKELDAEERFGLDVLTQSKEKKYSKFQCLQCFENDVGSHQPLRRRSWSF